MAETDGIGSEERFHAFVRSHEQSSGRARRWLSAGVPCFDGYRRVADR